MRISFDAKTCDEANHRHFGLAECVAFAAAYGGDGGGHRISSSARLDAQRLDHLAPFFRFIGDEFAESGGRARKDWAGELGEPRLDLGIGKARVDLVVERANDLGRRVPGRADTEECALLEAR